MRERKGRGFLYFILLSLALHALLLLVTKKSLLFPDVTPDSSFLSVEYVAIPPSPTPEKKPEDLPQKEKKEAPGQIVELPPPEVEEEPLMARFLAEQSRKVERETKSERFKINPEVVTPTYSDETSLKFEDLLDLGIKRPSTGATPGWLFDKKPSQMGMLMPQNISPWDLVNKPGLMDPVPVSHGERDLKGAPQNDYLDLPAGEGTYLNTREFLYAGYMNRIRRLVNFYYGQALDNVRPTERLIKRNYVTTVSAILDSQGKLDEIRLVESCGFSPFDQALIKAFHMAAPFPNPPKGLVDEDGKVRLPLFVVHLDVSFEKAPYFTAVDPRAGVQFPGALKSPR